MKKICLIVFALFCGTVFSQNNNDCLALGKYRDNQLYQEFNNAMNKYELNSSKLENFKTQRDKWKSLKLENVINKSVGEFAMSLEAICNLTKDVIGTITPTSGTQKAAFFTADMVKKSLIENKDITTIVKESAVDKAIDNLGPIAQTVYPFYKFKDDLNKMVNFSNTSGDLINQIKEQINVFDQAINDYEIKIKNDKEKINAINEIKNGIDAYCNNSNSFTDSRDGQTYKIVKIGNQIWMAQNLNYSTGSSWCNDCGTYGRLYDWESAKSACPSGWHLPSKDEWQTLIDYLGGSDVAGGKLKSTSGWNSPNTGATNSSGFSGVPGGGRGSDDGRFGGQGSYGGWWSASEDNATNAWYCILFCAYPNASLDDYYFKSFGFSVRCVKD